MHTHSWRSFPEVEEDLRVTPESPESPQPQSVANVQLENEDNMCITSDLLEFDQPHIVTPQLASVPLENPVFPEIGTFVIARIHAKVDDAP